MDEGKLSYNQYEKKQPAQHIELGYAVYFGFT